MARGAGLLRSTTASITAGATTAVLARLAATVLSGTPQTLDTWVAGGVITAGAVAAAVLTLGCALLAVAALRRLAGLSSRRLEAVSARLTPLVVRRALAVTVSAGLGLGAVALPAGASEADLGWTVTSTTTSIGAAPSSATTMPTTSAPVADPGAPPTTAVPTTAAPDSGAPGLVSSEPDPGGAWTPTVAPAGGSRDGGTPREERGSGAVLAASPSVAPSPATSTSSPTSSSSNTPTASPPTAESFPTGTSAGRAAPSAATSSPDRMAPGPTPTALPLPAALPAQVPDPAPASGTVTVAAGDSLWTIAATHLPAGSTDQEIASEWPRWYDQNRATIGPDPGLIQPAQTLEVPAAAVTTEESS